MCAFHKRKFEFESTNNKKMPHMLCLFAFYYVYYIHIFILLFFFSFLTHKCVHTCIDRRMRKKNREKVGLYVDLIWFYFIWLHVIWKWMCVCVCLCVSSMKWCFGLLFDLEPRNLLGMPSLHIFVILFQSQEKKTEYISSNTHWLILFSSSLFCCFDKRL